MTSNSTACVYRVLEDGIQEFVLTEVSRRALDEMFDITERVLNEAAARNDRADLAVPVLIDSSVGLQLLNYTFIRMRTLVNKFPARRTGRVALLLPSSPLLKTISIIMRPLAPIRIFGTDERDQAMAWLREAFTSSPS
jgi:hypothetical protein